MAQDHGQLQLLQTAMAKMTAFTAPVITPLYDGKTDGLRHVGTGWFLGSPQPALVTAKHVVAEVTDPGVLAFSTSSEYPMLTPPPGSGVPHPTLDAISFAIPASFFENGEKQLINPAAFGRSDALAGDLLFIHGYPGTQAKPAPGGAFYRSQPFLTRLREPETLAAEPEIFCIDYSPIGTQNSNGAAAELNLPRGLSGSPVWRLNFRPDDGWDPAECQLVGMAIEYEENTQLIRCLRIECLLV